MREFFFRSISCLEEKDSEFCPSEGMLTVAQQVAHVAQSIDWFIEGMQNEKGFDLDFENHWNDVTPVSSLDSAKQWVERAFENAATVISNMSEDELLAPLPAGPVLGAEPKHLVVGGISDHTAHHRGALTVYSRLLGKVAKMPYEG